MHERVTVQADKHGQIGIMVPPQNMVFSEVFTRDAAKGHEFRMPTIDASGPLGTEPFAQLGFPPRCTGRIPGALYYQGSSPSSAKLVVYVLSSFHDRASRIVRRARRSGALRGRSRHRV